MPFRRYVSIGRVAYVNLAEDPLYGKLVVIVDVVDQNRVRPAGYARGCFARRALLSRTERRAFRTRRRKRGVRPQRCTAAASRSQGLRDGPPAPLLTRSRRRRL